MVYADLGEIISSKKPGREKPEEITLFKSVGLAIQDISTAHYTYIKALNSGRGTDFTF